jgi:acetoacetyl-CoA reductase
MRLRNKICIVTGAGQGIGAATAAKFAAEGATVIGCDRHPPADGYAVDVTDRIQVNAMVAEVLAQHGRIDVLVNNAGITKDGLFHKMTPDQWYAVINTNLNSLFNMTRPVWEGMRERKFGRVICISSINGQKGQMGQVNYSAAKAGDMGFVKALAQEGARSGITVNTICPGYIATEMVKAINPEVVAKNILPLIPVGRLGEPHEIARTVLFLASDDAGFITGSTISANGGQSMV